MKWIELGYKKKRMFFGLLMFSCFIDLILFFNFWFETFDSMDSFILGLGMYYYMWIPSVLCILLLYYLLTKVYPYQEKTVGG
jgi:hypothetical protein